MKDIIDALSSEDKERLIRLCWTHIKNNQNIIVHNRPIDKKISEDYKYYFQKFLKITNSLHDYKNSKNGNSLYIYGCNSYLGYKEDWNNLFYTFRLRFQENDWNLEKIKQFYSCNRGYETYRVSMIKKDFIFKKVDQKVVDLVKEYNDVYNKCRKDHFYSHYSKDGLTALHLIRNYLLGKKCHLKGMNFDEAFSDDVYEIYCRILLDSFHERPLNIEKCFNTAKQEVYVKLGRKFTTRSEKIALEKKEKEYKISA